MRNGWLATAFVLTLASSAGATDYFVDSVGGSDASTGTSPAEAWQTLGPVHAATFAPGDVISFRRGGQWNEGLLIDASGTANAPIVFGAYDTGPAPIFEAPSGDPWANAIRVQGQSYVEIRDVMVRNVQEAGIHLQDPSDHVVVRDCEATDVGIGVIARGTNQRVTGCYFHDLHMVRNTAGGDDDYGAVGVMLVGTGHEIDHNQFERCIAPSYDYGTDGGAVEFWATVRSCSIHHNVARDTNGFAEIGGQSGDENHDNVLAYNLAVDTYGFGYYHTSGTFGVDLSGLRIENNTIVDRTQNWATFGFADAPSAATALVRNNVVVTDGDRIANHDGFTHDHNLFWLNGGGAVGFSLGEGELEADPRFVDAATPDVHLQPDSPAIDSGVDLGWSEDVDGHPVPQGAAPDLGAREYGDAAAGGGAGAGGEGTGGSGAGAAGGASGGPGDGADSPGPDDSGSCGCRIPRGSHRPRAAGWLAALLLGGLRRRRIARDRRVSWRTRR